MAQEKANVKMSLTALYYFEFYRDFLIYSVNLIFGLVLAYIFLLILTALLKQYTSRRLKFRNVVRNYLKSECICSGWYYLDQRNSEDRLLVKVNPDFYFLKTMQAQGIADICLLRF